MSQEIKVTGMVLQAGNIGEYDKRIVLLTKERGRISAFARGAKKATSQYAAACQPFTFGEFSLYEGKNSFNLMWAGVENYFDTLKKDLDLIYYASYFCELASYLTRENNDELEILNCHLSNSECCRLFQRNVHLSPVDYLNQLRIHMSLSEIIKHEKKITDIAKMYGFSGSSYFSEMFKKTLGITPRAFYKSVLQQQTLSSNADPIHGRR